MDIKERYIDIRQYVLYLFEKMYIIVVVAIICGLALSGYDYLKQKKAATGNIASVSDIIARNRAAYFDKDNFNYTDAIIPEGVFNSYGRVYIDYSLEGLGDSENIDSDIIANMSHDVTMLVRSTTSMSEIIDELQLESYPDMANISPSDLSYMINVNLQGIHIVNIVVSDVNPERAKMLGDAVIDKFVEKSKDYLKVSDIKILDEATESKTTKTGTWNLDNKKLFKYLVFGCALGVLLSAILLFVVYIFTDTVRTDEDINFAGTVLYSRILEKNKEVSYEKIAGSILNEPEVKSLIIVPVDDKTDINDLYESVKNRISEDKRNKSVIKADSLLSSADLYGKLTKVEGVLLAASFGKTKENNLIRAVREIERTGKKCMGVIITDSKKAF